VPEPTGGERHPFADIIDLFREAAPAPDAPADAPVGPEVAAPPAPAHVARTHHPAAVAPPAPTGRRRVVLLLPVALLGLTGGAAAAVIHGLHTSPTASPPPSIAPTAPDRPTPTQTPSPTQSLGESTPAVAAQEYSRALDRLAAAQSTADLAGTARGLTAGTVRLRTAKTALGRAEAAHIRALVALGTLDSATADGLTSYPRLATATTRASDAVAKAAAGRSDVPDPSVATGNVLALAGAAAVTGLDTQLGRLADAAGAARLTAQLRVVAAQARALLPAAHQAARRTATAVAGNGDTAAAAAVDAQALQALAGLAVLDADHLGSWATLRGPLQQALTAAGVATASTDVRAIDALIVAAQKKIDAWVAQGGTAGPGTDTSGGPTAVPTTGTPTAPTPAQVKQATKAIDAYRASADALVDRYAQAIATLPAVSPGQEPSLALANRFNATSRLFAGLSASVSALRPPPGMTGAQAALADLVARGRTAASTGQAMALSAVDCNPAKRICVLGAMKAWPAYEHAVGALGSPAAVRGTLADSARTAKAAVAGPTQPRGTPSQVPPKPVV